MRRSGTTILFDALLEDPELRCFYEPLREQDVIGRRRQRGARHRRVRGDAGRCASSSSACTTRTSRSRSSTGAGRATRRSSSTTAARPCRELLAFLIEGTRGRDQGDAPLPQARRRRRDRPGARLVHLVRDPRAVTASIMFGRRGRHGERFPTADAFFEARSERKLWSSGGSRSAHRRARLDPEIADPPDFMRVLAVWRPRSRRPPGGGQCSASATCGCATRTSRRSRRPGASVPLLGRPMPNEGQAPGRSSTSAPRPIPFEDDPRWAEAAERSVSRDRARGGIHRPRRYAGA